MQQDIQQKKIQLMFKVARSVYYPRKTRHIASFLFRCARRAKKGIAVTKSIVIGPGETWEDECITVNHQHVTAEYEKFCIFCKEHGIHVQ